MTRSLSDTLARIAARKPVGTTSASAAASSRLRDVAVSGRNPGALTGRCFVPAGLKAGAPLVVALHGCTQTAAGYDGGTGWSVLAEREGFALLLPEQTRSNNPNLCFNWFQPGDIARVGGEAESIASMIAAMVAEQDLDPARVYVTGLSAGGAMAGAMLATYPELFAGGAIIGGLPYGTAASIPEAFDRMRGVGGADDAALVAAVRRGGRGQDGPWPTVSVWHGTGDGTVNVANLDSIGRQWRGVHGVLGTDPAIEHGEGWTHRSWRGVDRRVVVEDWSIAGMGHGVPIAPDGPDRLGERGPYMLDVGLSSTAVIAASWGLVGSGAATGSVETARVRVAAPVPERPSADADADAASSQPPAVTRVQRVIEDALRGAGLMR
jgi:poly(hydroxyalkanoate) depolymerase family esterase